MQDRYLKLTDAQLNLATSFQRWQMEFYGNCLAQGRGFAPPDDSDRVLEDKINQHFEIENNWPENLNQEL